MHAPDLSIAAYKDIFIDGYRQNEGRFLVDPDYFNRSKNLRVNRLQLVQWLLALHERDLAVDETLYLSVNIFDRYLEKVDVQLNMLELTALTCYFIASKYEECTVYDPLQFCKFVDSEIGVIDLLACEASILQTLKFNLTVISPPCFIQHFAIAADAGEEAEMMANFLCELALCDVRFSGLRPSIIVAVAFSIATESIEGDARSGSWYDAKVLASTRDMLCALHRDTPRNNEAFVKYKKDCRFGVSDILLE